MDEDRGQGVAIVPFYEAELKFNLLCPCACCSKHCVPGSSSAAGASGHLWSGAKPSSPARHRGLIRVIYWVQWECEPCRVFALLWRLPGCLVWASQAHELAHNPTGWVLQAMLWAQPLGLAMAPGLFMGEEGLGAQAAQKEYPGWHEGNGLCTVYSKDKEHWMSSLVLLWSQIKAYWKAFLPHPSSIWLWLSRWGGQ